MLADSRHIGSLFRWQQGETSGTTQHQRHHSVSAAQARTWAPPQTPFSTGYCRGKECASPPSEAPPKKKRGRPRKNAETTQPQPLFENEVVPSVISPRKEAAAVNAHIVGAPLEKVSHDGDKLGGSVEEISDDGDTNRSSSTASKPEVADVAKFLQNLNDLEDVFEKQLKEKTRERDRKQRELLKIQQEISVLDQDIVQLKEKKKVEVDDHMKKITGAGFYRKKS